MQLTQFHWIFQKCAQNLAFYSTIGRIVTLWYTLIPIAVGSTIHIDCLQIMTEKPDKKSRNPAFSSSWLNALLQQNKKPNIENAWVS